LIFIKKTEKVFGGAFYKIAETSTGACFLRKEAESRKANSPVAKVTG
jgi:hypothetical protein